MKKLINTLLFLCNIIAFEDSVLNSRFATEDDVIATGMQILQREYPEALSIRERLSFEIITSTAERSRTRQPEWIILRESPHLRDALYHTFNPICNKEWFCHKLRKRFDGLIKCIRSRQVEPCVYDKYENITPVETPCGHYYHRGHLLKYLEKYSKDSNCPICRQKIDYSKDLKTLEYTKAPKDECCMICLEDLIKIPQIPKK